MKQNPKTIQELIQLAKNKQVNSRIILQVGVLNPKTAEKIKEEHGENVEGFYVHLDIYGVRHTLDKHTNEELEEERGNIPIEDVDFQLVPFVVGSPDGIRTDLGKQKNTIIIFLRIKIAYEVVVVFSINKRRKRLLFKTMYKRKKKKK